MDCKCFLLGCELDSFCYAFELWKKFYEQFLSLSLDSVPPFALNQKASSLNHLNLGLYIYIRIYKTSFIFGMDIREIILIKLFQIFFSYPSSFSISASAFLENTVLYCRA
jgi:hypothetical protein